VRERDDKFVASQFIVRSHHDLRRLRRKLLLENVIGGEKNVKARPVPIVPMTVLNSLYATEVTAKRQVVWRARCRGIVDKEGIGSRRDDSVGMIATLDPYKCRYCQHGVLLAWGKKVCIKGNWKVNIFKIL
jgi:hypothetical protein